MLIFAVRLKDGTYFTRGSVYSDPATPEFWPDRTRANKWASAYGGTVEEWEAGPVNKEQSKKPEGCR